MYQRGRISVEKLDFSWNSARQFVMSVRGHFRITHFHVLFNFCTFRFASAKWLWWISNLIRFYFRFFFLNRKFNGLLNSAKWDFGDTDITHPLENGTETVHQSTFGLNKPVHLKSTIDYLITKSFCQKLIHCFKNVKTS